MTSRPAMESLAGQDPCTGVPAAAFDLQMDVGRGACAGGQGSVGTRPSPRRGSRVLWLVNVQCTWRSRWVQVAQHEQRGQGLDSRLSWEWFEALMKAPAGW